MVAVVGSLIGNDAMMPEIWHRIAKLVTVSTLTLWGYTVA